MDSSNNDDDGKNNAPSDPADRAASPSPSAPTTNANTTSRPPPSSPSTTDTATADVSTTALLDLMHTSLMHLTAELHASHVAVLSASSAGDARARTPDFEDVLARLDAWHRGARDFFRRRGWDEEVLAREKRAWRGQVDEVLAVVKLWGAIDGAERYIEKSRRAVGDELWKYGREREREREEGGKAGRKGSEVD